MKILITILLLALCSGCATWQHTALSISKEPYHSADNNCVHKGDKFMKLEGGVAWTVRVHGVGAHRMVKLGKWWVDPTAGKWYLKLPRNITALYRPLE